MKNDNPYFNSNYDKKVNKILKTYNSILAKCRNIPISPDKNVIVVDDINSMVNTQIETRKPIIYYQEEVATSFMILDQEEVYIYMIKKFYDKESKVESIVKSIENSKNSFYSDVLPQDEENEIGLLGEPNTSLVPVKKWNIFSLFFIDRNKRAELRERKRKAQRNIY